MDRDSSYAPSSVSDVTNDPSQASSATLQANPMKKAVKTDKAPPPLPFFSQAIICQGMVYCSGSIGMSPVTKKMVDGGVGDRTAQALNNLSAVLEEAGSSLRNVVKCNIFLNDMTNFAAMNRVYDTFFQDPKPCRTCVAVSELPMKTDVEIECIAHLRRTRGESSMDDDHAIRLSPKKKPLLGISSAGKGPEPLTSPADEQLQTELLEAATATAKSLKQAADDETRQAFEYFANCRKSGDEDAVELFFRSIPEHLNTDAEYRERYRALRSACWEWAKTSFDAVTEPPTPLYLMELAESSPVLAEYINSCTSLPQGTDWERHLDERRPEIVYSILGKALEMFVFGQELFGTKDSDREKLQDLDWEKLDEDGFQRQRIRAAEINKMLDAPTMTLPSDFNSEIQTIHHQLLTLLSPLLPHSESLFSSDDFSVPFFKILFLAAKLHLDIRRDPAVIYYFVPAPAPGSQYDYEEMQIINEDSVKTRMSDPETVDKVRTGQVNRIATVTGWPGLVAYRRIPPLGYEDDERTLHPDFQSGVTTHTLALADVVIDFFEPGSNQNTTKRRRKSQQHSSLRAELSSRANERDRKDEVHKERMRKLSAAAGAVTTAFVAALGISWATLSTRGITV
ncbi:MAG: hypothetical protein Q9220_005619 [cf. Caloplaca sp. 1 TL-2023]